MFDRFLNTPSTVFPTWGNRDVGVGGGGGRGEHPLAENYLILPNF